MTKTQAIKLVHRTTREFVEAGALISRNAEEAQRWYIWAGGRVVHTVFSGLDFAVALEEAGLVVSASSTTSEN